jgi:hypothetical protein
VPNDDVYQTDLPHHIHFWVGRPTVDVSGSSPFAEAQVRMSDGLYELQSINLAGWTLPAMAISTDLAKWIPYLKRSNTSRICDVHAAIQWRRTSKAEDETIAIAGLLNVDVDKLLRAEGEERKVQFWKLLGSVPQGIV